MALPRRGGSNRSSNNVKNTTRIPHQQRGSLPQPPSTEDDVFGFDSDLGFGESTPVPQPARRMQQRKQKNPVQPPSFVGNQTSSTNRPIQRQNSSIHPVQIQRPYPTRIQQVDSDDEFFEEDVPSEKKMSYSDYYDDSNVQFDDSFESAVIEDQQSSIQYYPQQTYDNQQYGQSYMNDNTQYEDPNIVYVDDVRDIMDKNGVIQDGPGAPRVREYPKRLPNGGPKVRRLQPNGKYKIIEGSPWEVFTERMGESEAARKKVEEEINKKPYDSTGHLRIFLISPAGRPYELGSANEAQELANSLRAKKSMIFNNGVNLHYREGDSTSHKEPEWGTKKK